MSVPSQTPKVHPNRGAGIPYTPHHRLKIQLYQGFGAFFAAETPDGVPEFLTLFITSCELSYSKGLERFLPRNARWGAGILYTFGDFWEGNFSRIQS